MKLDRFEPEFVEFIPKSLQPGVLYISQRYMTASHLCACGCREKVVTPLSPADWQLRNDAGVVSLHPSIGNWNYACRSHYWIRRNRVVWAGGMSERQIARVQAKDLADKARYVERVNLHKERAAEISAVPQTGPGGLLPRLWSAIKQWLLG